LEVLINSHSDVEHEIEIVVPQEELREHFEKGYREHAKKISMPGFRPGKVPLQMIKRLYGPAIEAEVIEKLANDLFKQAIDERDIKPFGQPVLENIDMKPEAPVSIKIKYETMPDTEAKDYTGLQIERLRHNVTVDEVEDEIRYLLKSRKKLEEEEIALDDDYRVTCEIQMLDAEGNPIAGQKNDNLVVDLDDENLNRDLKAELLNMKVGEEKDVEFTHDNKDGGEDTERAHLKVLKVEKVTLPELDDAFANEVTHGRYVTVEALREGLFADLNANWKQRYDQLFETEIRNEIIRRNIFAVPSQMVENMKTEYLNHLRDRQPDKKLPENFDVDDYKKSIDNEVVSLIRWMFLRDSIIKQENIAVADEDVMAKAEEEAAKLHIEKERLLEYYKTSSATSDQILNDKLLRFLADASEIKDVNDDDISQSPLMPFAEIPHDHEHDHDHDHHGHDHEHDHDHGHENTHEDESKEKVL
jgi:trigger factor